MRHYVTHTTSKRLHKILKYVPVIYKWDIVYITSCSICAVTLHRLEIRWLTDLIKNIHFHSSCGQAVFPRDTKVTFTFYRTDAKDGKDSHVYDFTSSDRLSIQFGFNFLKRWSFSGELSIFVWLSCNVVLSNAKLGLLKVSEKPEFHSRDNNSDTDMNTMTEQVKASNNDLLTDHQDNGLANILIIE